MGNIIKNNNKYPNLKIRVAVKFKLSPIYNGKQPSLPV